MAQWVYDKVTGEIVCWVTDNVIWDINDSRACIPEAMLGRAPDQLTEMIDPAGPSIVPMPAIACSLSALTVSAGAFLTLALPVGAYFEVFDSSDEMLYGSEEAQVAGDYEIVFPDIGTFSLIVRLPLHLPTAYAITVN